MARKTLIYSLTVIAALTTIISISLALYAQSTSKRWKLQLSNLRNAGEPLTIAEIQLRRTPFPRGRLTIADIVTSTVVKVKSSLGPNSRGVLGMTNGLAINFFSGIPRDAINTTRKYFAPRKLALDGLMTIHNLEPGRFKITYNGTAQERMATFTETSPPIQSLTQLLFLDATLKLIDGDTEAAAAILPTLFDVVSPLTEEPSFMAHLRQTSTAIRILASILRVGTLDAKTLQQLDNTLSKYLKLHSMKWALWSDRALYIYLFDQTNEAIGFLDAVFSITKRGSRQQGLEMFGWVIEAGDDPAKLLAAKNKLQLELSTFGDIHMYANMLLTPVLKSITYHLICVAEIQAARIGIAAERFRLSKGEFPLTLDQLVPIYLTEIPDDPFDHAKMKIKKIDNGLIIYSVGEDGIDNGGQVVPRKGEKRPLDRGFLLLNKSSRGLVVIDSTREDGG